MPNRQSLDLLIAALEGAKDEQFNILHVFTRRDGGPTHVDVLHHCGTAACVAGWVRHVGKLEIDRTACDWLGINNIDGMKLFMPDDYCSTPENYPRLRAIDVLKHLRDTGEVDWDRFPAENYTARAGQ